MTLWPVRSDPIGLAGWYRYACRAQAHLLLEHLLGLPKRFHGFVIAEDEGRGLPLKTSRVVKSIQLGFHGQDFSLQDTRSSVLCVGAGAGSKARSERTQWDKEEKLPKTDIAFRHVGRHMLLRSPSKVLDFLISNLDFCGYIDVQIYGCDMRGGGRHAKDSRERDLSLGLRRRRLRWSRAVLPEVEVAFLPPSFAPIHCARRARKNLTA